MTLPGPSIPGGDLPIFWGQKSLEALHGSVMLLWVSLAGTEAGTFHERVLINQRDGGY